MKKFLFLVIFGGYQITANTLEITNLTSSQLTIHLQTTSGKQVDSTIPANINPILNDIREPDPHPTIIEFDNNPVEKLVISRFATTLPQIIYYDNQNSSDDQQAIAGMKKLSMSTSNNKMIVWPDYVEINNIAYTLQNLDSYTTRANKLKNNLSKDNLDVVQKELDDLAESIKLVKASDKASQMSMQTMALEALVDTIASAIKITKNINENIKTVQDLQSNLALGNNNVTGTNKPYKPADDSIERAIQTLRILEESLKVLNQANITGVAAQQATVLRNAMNSLQRDIDQMQISRRALSREELLMAPTRLKTFQNT